jgi:hypothetical protein
MKTFSFLLAMALVSNASAFLKAEICNDWVGDNVFAAFKKTCDEVYDVFNGEVRTIDELCVNQMSDGSPTAVSYASTCCASKVSSCPVAQLCMQDILYTPTAEVVVGGNVCGELAFQWAYSDVSSHCATNGGVMAAFASKCCADGISICPVSQLCMVESKYTPYSIAFGDTTCGELAHQWSYTDKVTQCEDKEVEMSYFSNLCCSDGLSV